MSMIREYKNKKSLDICLPGAMLLMCMILVTIECGKLTDTNSGVESPGITYNNNSTTDDRSGLFKIEYFEPEVIAKSSDIVIEGNVLNTESRWGSGHRMIYTYTTIEVSNSIIGELNVNDKIVVKDLGGTLDGLITHSDSQAKYQVGEEVLVFLLRENGYYRTNYLELGKFNKVTENNRTILRRNIDPKLFSNVSENNLEYDYFQLIDKLTILPDN